jgi:hypothetical protein
MIIRISDETLEKYKTNEEIAKVIVDILNGDFKYPGIEIYSEPLENLSYFHEYLND